MAQDVETLNRVLDTGAALGQPKEIQGLHYALVPDGFKYQSLNTERCQEFPKRVRASLTLNETASFVQYLNGYKQRATQIWCDRSTASFKAVIDYHDSPKGGDEVPPDNPARWGEHRAELALRYTPEWKAWKEHNTKPFTQLAFAEFLEDQTPFIVAPPGAELLEIALNLEETGKAAFQSTQRLQDGARTFKFQDDKSTSVKVPEIFELDLAPFEGAAIQRVKTRLRYRVNNGVLAFFYVLVNPELVEKAAIDSAVKQIEDTTGLKVLFGSLTSMGCSA